MPEELSGQQPRQDVQPLIEDFRPDAAIGRLAEQPEVSAGGSAEAHAEDDPPATEQVQRGDLLGQLPWPPPGYGGNHRAQLDP
jgi:hypothetical protein